MLKTRLIACLIIRGGLIVQSIGFNKYLPIGQPLWSIRYVNQWDVDEIVVIDISATGEERGPSIEVLDQLAESCAVPLTVGGGISSSKAAAAVIRSGADKVCINSAAITDRQIIGDMAERLGSQCVVVSVDCKQTEDGNHVVHSDSGRQPTRFKAEDFARMVEAEGAGEIFLNSIDRDGSKLGFDIGLIRKVTSAVSIPVIACGGVGRYDDFATAVISGGAEAVAAANIFHHAEHSTILAKAAMLKAGIDVRIDSVANYEKQTFDSFGRLRMHDSDHLDVEK